MTEILYCPKNNELFLFMGACEFDVQTKFDGTVIYPEPKTVEMY